jgi:hypothetical protein
MTNKTELMQEFEVEYIDYFSNAKAENIFHSLAKDSLGFYIHPEIVFAFFIFGVKDRQLSKEVEQLLSEIESLKKGNSSKINNELLNTFPEINYANYGAALQDWAFDALEHLKSAPLFDRSTHKIVPIEPTDLMINEGECFASNATLCYRDMIAAAPEYQSEVK